MSAQTPEQELAEFLAASPSWKRKALQSDLASMSDEELQASRSEVSPSTTTAEYLELCRVQKSLRRISAPSAVRAPQAEGADDQEHCQSRALWYSRKAPPRQRCSRPGNLAPEGTR